MNEQCSRQECNEPVTDIFEMQLTSDGKVTQIQRYPLCQKHHLEVVALCMALQALTGIPKVNEIQEVRRTS